MHTDVDGSYFMLASILKSAGPMVVWVLVRLAAPLLQVANISFLPLEVVDLELNYTWSGLSQKQEY